jgi:hypothetical protein
MKEKVKGKKSAAMKLRRQARSQMEFGKGEAELSLGTAAATTEVAADEAEDQSGSGRQARLTSTLQDEVVIAPKRTASEAMLEHYRKVRAGLVPNNHDKIKAPERSVNPLFDLPEEQRAKLFAWLRECPYDDAVRQLLREQGMAEVTPAEVDDFFQFQAEMHWEHRIGRAAQEATALVRLAEKSPVRFSAGILAALGQEAFRQIASGQVEPDAMGKLATLFLKARSDERADQMQELKREKLRHELQGQIDHALEKLAEEVDRHPVAREAFEALRKELARSLEEAI